MRKHRKLLLVAAIVMSVVLSVGSTMAYLTSTVSDVNVMTLGNVEIAQHEYERVVNANGEYELVTSPRGEGYKLQEFSQAKPLFPAVGKVTGWDDTVIWFDQLSDKAVGGQMVLDGLKNVQDKIVLVENTGKSDAYVRTIIAFEVGSLSDAYDDLIMINHNDSFWAYEEIGNVEIDGNVYFVAEYVYQGSSTQHAGGILPPGAYTYDSLAQIYLKPETTNEDIIAIDGNKNGTYDILVVSQAVQTAGFDSASEALDEAFGDITTTNHPWVDGVDIPAVVNEEGVNYVYDSNGATVIADGGDTMYRGILSDAQSSVAHVTVGEGITRLNDRALCKAPSLESVTLPDSLTYIDESVFQQSGIKEIEIPENVTYIGKMAMGSCNNLEKIVIKAKDVTIANYVARSCPTLKEVYIYSDSVTFESTGMFFTTAESGDASTITFYVSNQAVADALFNASTSSKGYGMLIKSIDGATTYYNTLK